MSSMHTTVKPESSSRIHRRDLVRSLFIGLAIGIVIGAPFGWLTHQIFARQRAAQVLLCRQQNFGLTEAQLEARCGNLY